MFTQSDSLPGSILPTGSVNQAVAGDDSGPVPPIPKTPGITEYASLSKNTSAGRPTHDASEPTIRRDWFERAVMERNCALFEASLSEWEPRLRETVRQHMTPGSASQPVADAGQFLGNSETATAAIAIYEVVSCVFEIAFRETELNTSVLQYDDAKIIQWLEGFVSQAVDSLARDLRKSV